MKTYIKSLIATFTLLVMSVCPQDVFAFTVGGINYDVTSSNTVAVSSNKSATGDIVIPNAVSYNGNDYTVTQIYAEAFSSTSITSIKLPGTIKSIGGNAFLQTKLTKLVIPNSVTEIGNGSFALCSDLVTLQLGSSVKSIGADIFTGLNSLETVISLNPVPPTVDTWGTTKTSATLYVPESAISAYSSTGILKNFNTIRPVSKNLDPEPEPEEVHFTSLTDLTVGNSVEKIASGFFSESPNLTSLTLGSGLTEIGDNAFSNCSLISEVVLPPAVENIGASAFAGCSKLENIIMGCNVKTIGEKAFDGCPATNVYITAQTPPTASNNTFSNYSGKLYLQGEEAIDAYYDAYTCWDRFNGYAMIEADDISMDRKPISGKPGAKFKLTASIQPSNATLPQLFWYSTNPEIAIVDNDGLVTILSPVSRTMMLAADDEDDFSSCKIIARTLYADGPVAEVDITRIIGSVEAEKVILGQETLSLMVGDTFTLTATVLPEDASDKTVTWTSSDESIVTVNADGVVTALSNGTAIITASTSTPGVTATCEVTVSDLNGVGSIPNAGDKLRDIFTMQGICIKHNATAEDIEALDPGMYIIGGKKVVIR